MGSEKSFFNLLDYIYIALMGVSCLFGMASGFARTLLSLCAWVGSGFLATATIPTVYDLVKPYISSSFVAEVVASVSAYLLCLVMLTVVARFISDMVKKSMFSGLDRAFGLLFGLIRGISLPLLIASSFLVFGIPKERYRFFNESQISTLMYTGLREIVPTLIRNRDLIRLKRPSKRLLRSLSRSFEELKIRALI